MSFGHNKDGLCSNLAIWHICHIVGPDLRNAAYKTRQRKEVKLTYPSRLSLRVVVRGSWFGTRLRTFLKAGPGVAQRRTKEYNNKGFPYMASIAADLI